jgi:NAD(P)H-hydrate epimerase
MRSFDERAVSRHGIAEAILMENAGLAVHNVLRSQYGARGVAYVVACGFGNNGGDGFVVARKLLSAGARVHVLVFGDPTKYAGAAGANWDMLRACGVSHAVHPSIDVAREAFCSCDVIVDALLGTGLTRDVTGELAACIHAMHEAAKPIVSVDIPSGIDGDTGQVRGVAVRATHTVTFGLPKRGNVLYPGAAYNGRLWVTHISFPPALVEDPAVTVHLQAPPPLPPRSPYGHKGSFGDVLVIAGAASYYGAPSFSALAHLRAGGGYARLAAPRSVTAGLGAHASELVLLPQDETREGSISHDCLDALVNLAAGVDFVILGPGVSLHEETQQLIRDLTARIAKPLLIDGDGLTAIARSPALLATRTAPTVVTPHPGEMARLTDMSVRDVVADPITTTQHHARTWNASIVLKGAHSLIAHPNGAAYVNPTGNAGMATAGSGDVLTGTITAMAGLGLGFEDAVRAGVFIHGLAGDLAAEAIGQDGMTARDVLGHLPAAVKAYRERYEEIARSCEPEIAL